MILAVLCCKYIIGGMKTINCFEIRLLYEFFCKYLLVHAKANIIITLLLHYYVV